MQFNHTWEKVLDKSKTQTRRIVKPGERLMGRIWCRFGNGEYDWIETYVLAPNKAHGEAVKWQVGRTYAIQPGRGQKAVGRIKLTAIRKERVDKISEADAWAEGCPSDYWIDGREWFFWMWDEVNNKPGCRIEDRPEVWVLEFELVEIVAKSGRPAIARLDDMGLRIE